MKQLVTILAIALAAFLVTDNSAHTYQDGAPAGNTGSPGDEGSSCNSPYCHGYAPQNSGEYVEIYVAIPLSTIDVYRITVEAGNTGGFQYEEAGFQACVEDASGAKIGELSTVSNTLTQIVEEDYITHTQLGTAPSDTVNGTHMWEFDWTPPANFDGEEATIYAASILTNNNGMNTGDVHVTASYTFNVGFALAEEDAINFSVYPNPVSEQINLVFETPIEEDTSISLMDMKGAEIVLYQGFLSQKEYNLVLPAGLVSGVYAIRIDGDSGQSSKRIILQ
jgi:hypothetical protein